ncbi:hypothetical protein FDECE_941 [Fusarium decemcellulare]|nr:hypothetical protein FDECE_941 [Fusarium decemcellulare]
MDDRGASTATLQRGDASDIGDTLQLQVDKADLSLLSATQACHLIRGGYITSEEYALYLLRRVRERDHHIRAWVHLDEHNILNQAKELDRVPVDLRGPLHGVGLGVKDVALVKDMPTRYGSTMHENDGPSATDAATVSILRSAGALIFGKTATTEFAATSKGGPCANPRNLDHTPGGSSSGSAAAVADYHVPIALGTQTGGSMIRPGSFTGIYAFKVRRQGDKPLHMSIQLMRNAQPTWGTVSTEGLGRFSITCDTPGFYARTVDDLDLLASVFHLESNYTPSSRNFCLQGARVAFVKSPMWGQAGPGTLAAWKQAHSLLTEAGCDITDLDLPEPFDRCQEWRAILVAGEARAAFLPQYLQAKDKLDLSLVKLVENHAQPSAKQMREAHNGVAHLRFLWDDLSSRFDCVITPSVPDEAPRGLASTGSSCFCAMWTLLHVPTLNVPGFTGKGGLPIGLTVTGPRYGDMGVLQAGRALGEVFTKAG